VHIPDDFAAIDVPVYSLLWTDALLWKGILWDSFKIKKVCGCIVGHVGADLEYANANSAFLV
jgi:hypothetical protein